MVYQTLQVFNIIAITVEKNSGDIIYPKARYILLFANTYIQNCT